MLPHSIAKDNSESTSAIGLSRPAKNAIDMKDVDINPTTDPTVIPINFIFPIDFSPGYDS